MEPEDGILAGEHDARQATLQCMPEPHKRLHIAPASVTRMHFVCAVCGHRTRASTCRSDDGSDRRFEEARTEAAPYEALERLPPSCDVPLLPHVHARHAGESLSLRVEWGAECRE